jgi:hypothetical protein
MREAHLCRRLTRLRPTRLRHKRLAAARASDRAARCFRCNVSSRPVLCIRRQRCAWHQAYGAARNHDPIPLWLILYILCWPGPAMMIAPLAVLAATVNAAPPWWSPYLPAAQRVLSAGKSESVAAALNGARDEGSACLHFVEQSALPVGESYESFIARTASVPTRGAVDGDGACGSPSNAWATRVPRSYHDYAKARTALFRDHSRPN